MSDFTLYLGGVGFASFEIPEEICAGGAQSLFKHKYPGGARTIDAMGPDDSDITWSGTFMDGSAQDRCKQIDIMRRQGQPIVMSFSGYSYLVMIASFEWRFKRTWHIPYTITLAVIQDQTQPGQTAAQDVGSQIISDAGTATSDSSAINAAIANLIPAPLSPVTGAIQGNINSGSAALATALAGVNSTIGSVASITTGTVNYQAGLGLQVNSALSIAQSLQTTLSNAMASAGAPTQFASGMSPQAMIASLTNLQGLSAGLAATTDATDVLGRMSVNIGLLDQ
jgi:hypothetical protein